MVGFNETSFCQTANRRKEKRSFFFHPVAVLGWGSVTTGRFTGGKQSRVSNSFHRTQEPSEGNEAPKTRLRRRDLVLLSGGCFYARLDEECPATERSQDKRVRAKGEPGKASSFRLPSASLPLLFPGGCGEGAPPWRVLGLASEEKGGDRGSSDAGHSHSFSLLNAPGCRISDP